jgi:nucleoside phosphorylase
MIRILILDDSKEKIDAVRKFLIEECNLKENLIDHRSTIKEGRKILYDNNYDLLLLDLVMPRDEETEASAEESLKFLDEIYYNSLIKIPVHIIGFSQYDELIKANLDNFEDKLWHLINFSFTSSKWKDKLKNKISHLISVKQNFHESIESKTKFDICIICALEVPELESVLELNCNWKEVHFNDDPLIYHEGTISTVSGNTFRVLACSINKMGMQAAASVSAMIIAKFRISYLFMAGICAGVRERGVNFGDVIIAEHSLDYGSGKLIEGANGELIFKPDPHQYPTDQSLISKVNNFIRSKDQLARIQSAWKGKQISSVLTAKLGPIASGSYVVSSKAFVSNIVETNRKLLAIDMEGYGVYLTCHYFNQTKCLFVKSICDFGDQDKNDDYQAYASFTSARFIHSFIVNML